jgi:hypothetical protein
VKEGLEIVDVKSAQHEKNASPANWAGRVLDSPGEDALVVELRVITGDEVDTVLRFYALCADSAVDRSA